MAKRCPVVIFPVDDILPLTDSSAPNFKRRRPFSVNGQKYLVKMRSPRFDVFRHNPSCVCCGVEGTVMGISFGGNANPHFNLYANIDGGGLLLMTKDHVVPIARGGKNQHDNYQTMCNVCNEKKGDK